MPFIGITICSVTALAINHVKHGYGCWGLQLGGRMSAFIYNLQILTAIVGICWLTHRLVNRKAVVRTAPLAAIVLLSTTSVAMFFATGWTIGTSIHNQGPENLLAYSSVALTSIAIGTYDWSGKFSLSNLLLAMTMVVVTAGAIAWFR